MRPTRPRATSLRTSAPRSSALLALAPLLVAAAACGGLGGSDPAPRSEPVGDVAGEVVRVELFERELLVRNTYDRVVRVRYEADTPVFFRGEQYRVENLEPGDVVRVDVLGDREGVLLAQRIDVEQSVQDRSGRVDPPPTIDEVEGEVVRVERMPNVLVLTSTERGTLRIGFSADTPVYYRGEQYTVSNLEPGDEVRVEVRQEVGELRTDYITVTRSVQESGGIGGGAPGGVETGEVETFTGRVTAVEPDRGRFTVATETRGTVTVLMPYRPLTADRDHFERLRTGDRVRFDGEWMGGGRVDLVRFDTRY
jgi:hypothetical protein